MDDVTARLMNRAEAALAQLDAHLEDEGIIRYTGRTRAAHAMVRQMAKQYRREAAQVKQARRRRAAVRRPASETVHERL